ncbi:MAG: hypothetical protein ABH954_00365 [Candidatus Omnitrophota bacterium]
MSEKTSELILLSFSIFLSLDSILVGIFLFFQPTWAIDLQRKFYEKINWRMEPINLKKEIRNTKTMGLFAIVVGTAALIYIIVK